MIRSTATIQRRITIALEFAPAWLEQARLDERNGLSPLPALEKRRAYQRELLALRRER